MTVTGNEFIELSRAAENLRQNTLTLREVYVWNSLHDYGVISPSINSFKKVFNNSWHDRPWRFDF